MPAAQQLALFCVDVDALNFSRILLIRCDAAVCLKLGADHCCKVAHRSLFFRGYHVLIMGKFAIRGNSQQVNQL
jgi:hypothetical protein